MTTKAFKQSMDKLFTSISEKYGKNRAYLLVRHLYFRYRKSSHNFLDTRLAFWLFDDYHYVSRVGTRWYACVGVGGVGKSTLMKNVLYFLDGTFRPDKDLAYSWADVIKIWQSYGGINTNKGTLLDEPDEFPFQSKIGRKLRKILGKARQGKYFFAICATDLSDIPNFLYKKLDGIFFLPKHGVGMFFKNRPERNSFVVQEIKKDYARLGYGIFYKYRKTEGCLTFRVKPGTPFDNSKILKKYLDTKEKDFINDMDGFNQELKAAEEKGKFAPKEKKIDSRYFAVKDMRDKGMTYDQIGTTFNVTGVAISNMYKKNKIIAKELDL